MNFKLIEYRSDGTSGEGLPIYAGQHTVTPKVNEEQVLYTKDAILRSNITVKKIPVEKVTNTVGGYTVTIG